MVYCFLTGRVNSDLNNLSPQQENNVFHHLGYLFNALHFRKIKDVHIAL